MKILTRVNKQKVIDLLTEQMEASYQRFVATHEEALLQMEIGIGEGFSSAIAIVNNAVEEDGIFTEKHLDRIRCVADCEGSSIKCVECADDKTKISGRHEVAVLMTAYTLIKSYMTET
nr:MAG TPA: hypothetical protein [Caudovirales sp. ct8Ze27]